MIMKFTIIMVLMFSLVLTVVAAETEYASIGGTGGDFRQGDGGFNPTVLSTIQNRGLTNGEYVPLVADVNADGVNEIVVLDGSTLRVYQNTSLNVLNSIPLNDSGAEYSPAVLFNIDGDAAIEIIIAPETGSNQIFIYELFNGTFQLEYFLPHTAPNSAEVGGVEHMIGCHKNSGEEAQCVLVSVNSLDNTIKKLFVQGFNATHVGTANQLESINTDATNSAVCLSRVRSVAVGDYDADGTTEFVFGASYGSLAFSELLKFYYIDISPELNISEEGEFTVTENPITTMSNGGNCAATIPATGATIGDSFTSPILANVEGGTGLNTIFGYMVDDNEFEMAVYDSGLNLVRTHPNDFLGFPAQADGRLMGNPMLMNVFGDTAIDDDYCIYSVEDVADEIGLLCGSIQTGRDAGGISDDFTIEFVYPKSGLFNITNDYGDFTNIGHASNMQENSVDLDAGFTDTTELVSPHGVFKMTSSTANGSFFDWDKYQLERIFPLTTERACIVVDYEQIGSSDLICRSDTLISYVNDNLVNGDAAISAYSENPCIDSGVVGINSTFQVEMTVVDQNDFPLAQDLVNSKVTLYADNGNAQVSEINNQTSGAEVVHLFEYPAGGINQTGLVRLKYEAWDNENPTNIDEINQQFTVGNAGVVFGDCVSSTIIALEEEVVIGDALADALPVDQVDNGITNSIIVIGGLTGLGAVTLWFIVMISISLGVWFAVLEGNVGGAPALGVIAILNVLMIFLGAQIGVFGTGLIVIMSVISIVILGVFAGKFFTGTSGGE